jgi:hypothetical protein
MALYTSRIDSTDSASKRDPLRLKLVLAMRLHKIEVAGTVPDNKQPQAKGISKTHSKESIALQNVN